MDCYRMVVAVAVPNAETVGILGMAFNGAPGRQRLSPVVGVAADGRQA
jgi:hypothetical protein